jgi:DNA-directed RNA polymerase subunit delta
MEGIEKMADWNQLSLLEAAETILSSNKQPMSFVELYQAICEVKELSEEDKSELISQVYADFIVSAKFVYVGDDLWDLKSRQSIDLWDKDGAYYDEFPDYAEELAEDEDEEEELDEEDEDEEIDEDEEEEDKYEEDLDFDEELEEEDIDYDGFEDEEEDFIEDESDIAPEDEEDFDDDKYNEYMDDYEKMYDE